MSESVKPWFRAHFIHVAETYGGDLATVPLEEKGKKVQILEFLTFGAENKVDSASAIWAVISDKSLFMPVKFSKDAVTACDKKLGRRLTGTRTALVTIKKFKIVSARIPARGGGMSVEPQLALLCESVSVIGSLGENKWGNPKELDYDADLREWSHGLRQDGGAGNVLKERKRNREANNADVPLRAKRPVSPRKPRDVEPRPRASTSLEPMDAYRKRWNDSMMDPLKFVLPLSSPRERSVEPQDARNLGSSSPSEKYSPSSSPISGWSPTPAMSSPLKVERASPSPKPSSYLTAPTPAQRRFKSLALSPVAQRKVARPPPPPPPPIGSGPVRILVPNSDTSQSQPSQPSQPSQLSAQASQPSPHRIKEEDIEMLDEDDAQTDRRLFRRRGSSLERAEPTKRRRMVKENDSPAGYREKLAGFSLGLDWVEWGQGVVGWDRVWSVLRDR
ncbi:hypothetical protein FB451DRAFT_221335 [Mycena latifolia]|nr:hypothetical protein FB451DRAFT_221335 [Mycena latifolia]